MINLTHDNPLGVLNYPTPVGGGIVWLSLGVDFGACDVRAAFYRNTGKDTDFLWDVQTFQLDPSKGNLLWKVDTNGSTYHRVSLMLESLSNEWTRDWGNGDIRPSKIGELPYCGIVVAASIIPDSAIA